MGTENSGEYPRLSQSEDVSHLSVGTSSASWDGLQMILWGSERVSAHL